MLSGRAPRQTNIGSGNGFCYYRWDVPPLGRAIAPARFGGTQPSPKSPPQKRRAS